MVGWIPCLLPREDGTLKVWHHCKVTTIVRADTCNVIVGTIRVARILGIVVFSDDVVVIFWLRQIEAAFSVGYPQTELVAEE